MIRAKAEHRDGSPLFLLGLTDENLDRLRGGEPVLVDLRELDGPAAYVVLSHIESEVSALMDFGAAFDVPRIEIDERLIPDSPET